MLEIRLEPSTGMTSVIDNLLTHTYYNRTGEQSLMDVKSINEMEKAIRFILTLTYSNNLYDKQSNSYMPWVVRG